MEISASEFKAKCLDIFDQLAAHTLDRVVVTKRGRPVAVLTGPPTREAEVEGLFGFMKGSVVIPPDLDLTAPVVDEPLSAEEGWKA